MNIKKISASVMAAAVMAVSLTACSDSKEKNGNSKPANNSTKNNTNSVFSEIKSAFDDDNTTSTPTESTNTEPGLPVYTDDPSIVYSPAEDFEYWYDEAAGGTMIRGYIGAGGEVAIPKEIDGKPVTIVDKNAFKGNTTITSIYIPSTITKIDTSAFEACTSLVNVTLVSGLEIIGYKAFLNCEKLKSIEIPDTVTELEGSLGSSVVSGYGDTFSGCISLETAVIGKGVNNISTKCFKNCSSLKSITIPGNVETIGNEAFSGCTNLETVVIEEGVKKIGQYKGPLDSTYVFSKCTSLTNLTLPESLERLERSSFSYCTSLTDVEIPSNCEIFGSGLLVFDGCKNIKAKFRGKTYTYDQLVDLHN